MRSKCPNLVKKDKHRCVTIDDSYCPSHFQLREYCKGRLHRICPFYLGYQKRQESFLRSIQTGGIF